MKRIHLLIFLTLILGLISCKPISMLIAKTTGEYIEPVKENDKSISTYCQGKKVKYDKLYILKSEDNFVSFLGKYKSVPGIYIFDKNKFLITTAFKNDCPWTMINLLYDTSLKTKSIQDTTEYSEILSHFNLVDNKSFNKDADYYILCTWAKFVPKLTDALFATINKQKEENKINVCHILLNVDLQEGWDSK